MSDDDINKYFMEKDKYQEKYNKRRTKFKKEENPCSDEMRAKLASRNCTKCSMSGGMLFEETSSRLVAKCLAEKPCGFSLDIKRRMVSDLWESFRTNKSILNEIDRSLIIMTHHNQNNQNYIQTTSHKNTHSKHKDTPYNVPKHVINDFRIINDTRTTEKKKEKSIEEEINKVKNINASEIADTEKNIIDIYTELQNLQDLQDSDKNDKIIMKQIIKYNKEQHDNYDNLRPLKYAYFKVENDPPDIFSLITREYSTAQQCEYNLI